MWADTGCKRLCLCSVSAFADFMVSVCRDNMCVHIQRKQILGSNSFPMHNVLLQESTRCQYCGTRRRRPLWIMRAARSCACWTGKFLHACACKTPAVLWQLLELAVAACATSSATMQCIMLAAVMLLLKSFWPISPSWSHLHQFHYHEAIFTIFTIM